MSPVCMHLFCGLCLPLEDQCQPSKEKILGISSHFMCDNFKNILLRPLILGMWVCMGIALEPIALWPLFSTERPMAAFWDKSEMLIISKLVSDRVISRKPGYNISEKFVNFQILAIISNFAENQKCQLS